MSNCIQVKYRLFGGLEWFIVPQRAWTGASQHRDHNTRNDKRLKRSLWDRPI